MTGLMNDALGLDPETLGVTQVALRSVVVYFVALVFVRMGDKRFFGKSTAFDIVIGIMFGSVMSRAITTANEFVPIIVAGGVLVGLHFVMAFIAFRSDRIGALIKGAERALVRDGEVQSNEMAAAHITSETCWGIAERGEARKRRERPPRDAGAKRRYQRDPAGWVVRTARWRRRNGRTSRVITHVPCARTTVAESQGVAEMKRRSTAPLIARRLVDGQGPILVGD